MTDQDGTSSAARDDSAGAPKATLLAQFTGLKIDQTQRFILREIAFYLSLFANLAIIALYEIKSHELRFLLLIPFASAVLFWVYAANQGAIKAITRYIATQIIPRFSGSPAPGGVFGWEDLSRGSFLGRFVSNVLRFIALWVTFSGVSLLALAVNIPPDVTHDTLWLAAAAAALLPYLLWFWFIIL